MLYLWTIDVYINEVYYSLQLSWNSLNARNSEIMLYLATVLASYSRYYIRYTKFTDMLSVTLGHMVDILMELNMEMEIESIYHIWKSNLNTEIKISTIRRCHTGSSTFYRYLNNYSTSTDVLQIQAIQELWNFNKHCNSLQLRSLHHRYSLEQ